MNSRKASSRVLTMPRTPSRPYMTVMVSMKTFTAREPDQTAIRKPREITSGRPPLVTSLRIGSATSVTPRSDSTVREASRRLRCTLWMVSAPVQAST